MDEFSNNNLSNVNSSQEDRLCSEWKEIQKTTFTNWANSLLSCQNETIEDLYTDLCDGILLIKLYETVSGQKIERYVKQPRIISHKLENISLVMKEMTNDGIKFVNLGKSMPFLPDPFDICNGNSKLILALIWHMILFYHIGFVPPSKKDNETDSKITSKKNEILGSVSSFLTESSYVPTVTPKGLILKLINTLIPEHKVTNLTTDWNNGKALAALVETFSPGSCPSSENWNDRNSLLNVTTALCLAEVHLGIPVLIEPHHMASKNVDELSVITYISSFMRDGGVAEKYFLNNLISRFPCLEGEISNMTTDWNTGIALCKLVHACHPSAFPNGYHSFERICGLELEQRKSLYISNIKTAMREAQRLFQIHSDVPAELLASPTVPALAVMSYICEFMKLTPVELSSNEKQVFPNDLEIKFYSTCNGLFTNEEIKFTITSKNPLNQNHTLVITVKYKEENLTETALDFKCKSIADCEWLIEFTPTKSAMYQVEARLNNDHIRGSPLLFQVQERLPQMPQIFIENFEKETFSVNESIAFYLRTDHPTENINCFFEDADTKRRVSCDSSRVSERMLKNSTRLTSPGTYHLVVQTVHANMEREVLVKTVQCLPCLDHLIKIIGPQSILVRRGDKVSFTFDTRAAGCGKLELKLRPQINQVIDNKCHGTVYTHESDGVWDCIAYINSKISFYWFVDVFWNNEPVPSKSITINTFDPDLASLSGNGLNPTIKIDTQLTFQVFLGECGKIVKLTGKLEKENIDKENNNIIPIEFLLLDRHLYEAKYHLCNVGTYYMKLFLNDVLIKESAKVIEAVDITRLKYEIVSDCFNVGENIEIKITVPISAGKGDLFYAMEGPEGPMKVFVEPIQKDSVIEKYLLTSVPNKPGEYQLILQFGGINIPDFPKRFVVVDRCLSDVKNVKVEFGIVKAAFLHVENNFSVLFTGKAQNPALKGFYTYIDDEQTKHPIAFTIEQSDVGCKIYRVCYKVKFSMDIRLRIFLGDFEIHGSPFDLPVIDFNRVEIDFNKSSRDYMTCKQPYTLSLFIPYELELKDCLNASVIPPNGRIIFPEIIEESNQMKYSQWSSKNGRIYKLNIDPSEEGKYIVHFSFLSHPIPGFPQVLISKIPQIFENLDRIKITVPHEEFTIGTLSSVFIDAREAGPGKLDVTLLDPNLKKIPFDILPIHCKRDFVPGSQYFVISDSLHDMFQINFNLENPGAYTMTLYWNNKKIPKGSLTLTAVSPLPDPSFSGGVVSEGFVGQAIHVIINDAEPFFDIIECHCVDSTNTPVDFIFEPTAKKDRSCVLSITPSVPGMHRIDVEINGEPIYGSPIFFNVSFPVNSKKVKVFGPGIVSGVLDAEKGKIYVETENAGSGLLQVAIQGPKNGFKLSLNTTEPQHPDDRPLVTVDYQPQISGHYKINILWSGEHVPGSPFEVYNCRNHRELHQISNGIFQNMSNDGSYTNLQTTFTC